MDSRYLGRKWVCDESVDTLEREEFREYLYAVSKNNYTNNNKTFREIKTQESNSTALDNEKLLKT